LSSPAAVCHDLCTDMLRVQLFTRKPMCVCEATWIHQVRVIFDVRQVEHVTDLVDQHLRVCPTSDRYHALTTTVHPTSVVVRDVVVTTVVRHGDETGYRVDDV